MKLEDMADIFVQNVLYRYPKHRSFTFSDVVHDMHGDSTGFPNIVASRMRRMAARKTILDHPTGPKILVVKDKGQHGRTGRPTNMYKFKEAMQ